ncbi:MAG: Gfo/Idh/MocA family oxidoreductase [Anaerolineaceae bacterium]|nr:Gfo/Idh/MocA family oxidoreductase [Anaerolineaceae bacterium]
MTLRVAIVSTGNVAGNNYLPFLARQPDLTFSYFNRTRDKAEACAATFGGQVADSIDDLMRADPDIVFLLSSETARYELARAILQRRPKRLFFEKPLVAMLGQAQVTEDDFEKGRELLRSARAGGTETAMIFNYRFFDQTQTALQQVAERGFGALTQITGLVHYNCWSHCIDLVHLFAGPLTEIAALPGPVVHQKAGYVVEDVAAAFSAGKASGTIIGTATIDRGFPLFEMLFSFEGGRLTFRGLDGDMEILDYSGARHELLALTREHSSRDQYRLSFDKALDAYLTSVREGGEPPVPGLAGLQELQFEAALKRSIRLGRPVRVQDEFPLD